MEINRLDIQSITDVANRLSATGNKAAASCLYNIAAAMSVNYETVLADKLCKEMQRVINGDL